MGRAAIVGKASRWLVAHRLVAARGQVPSATDSGHVAGQGLPRVLVVDVVGLHQSSLARELSREAGVDDQQHMTGLYAAELGEHGRITEPGALLLGDRIGRQPIADVLASIDLAMPCEVDDHDVVTVDLVGERGQGVLDLGPGRVVVQMHLEPVALLEHRTDPHDVVAGGLERGHSRVVGVVPGRKELCSVGADPDLPSHRCGQRRCEREGGPPEHRDSEAAEAAASEANRRGCRSMGLRSEARLILG